MDDAKTHLIIATLKVLCEQVRSLQVSVAIQKLIDNASPSRATRAAHHAPNAREIIANMVRNLEEEVLQSDEFGAWYQSLDELVLRSMRLVLLTQIDDLQAMVDNIQQYAEDHTSPHTKHRLVLWLKRIHMLLSLRTELLRIDDRWTLYRPAASSHR